MSNFKNIITDGYSMYESFLAQGGECDIYFAVGTGNKSWDEILPIPTENTSRLYNEFLRVLVTEIVYVDPATHEVVDYPTSTTRYTCSINDENYYESIIREYGLFAIDATGRPNSGTMICVCRHTKVEIPIDSIYLKYIYINV